METGPTILTFFSRKPPPAERSSTYGNGTHNARGNNLPAPRKTPHRSMPPPARSGRITIVCGF
jgi:hypothetical protein